MGVKQILEDRVTTRQWRRSGNGPGPTTKGRRICRKAADRCDQPPTITMIKGGRNNRNCFLEPLPPKSPNLASVLPLAPS